MQATKSAPTTTLKKPKAALVAEPLDLTVDERNLLGKMRDIAQKVVAANADRYDRLAVFPQENFRALHEAGLLDVLVPTSFGGKGIRSVAYVRLVAELAKACASTATIYHHHGSSVRQISHIGTQEQQRHYFKQVVDKGALLAGCGSEPSTSFNGRVALSTYFEDTDDGYRINGVKSFCTTGEGTSYWITYAVQKELVGQANVAEMQMFVVDANSPGLTLRDNWDTLGMRATVSKELVLEDCVVPGLSRLGVIGDTLRKWPYFAALGHSAIYQGIGEGAYEFAVEFAGTRTVKPFSHPISHFDRIQRKIADIAVAVHGGALAVERAARVMDLESESAGGKEFGSRDAVYLAKAIAGDVAMRATELAIAVGGGSVIQHGNPAERFRRDAQTAVLMAPNRDRCTEIVTRSVLGLEAVEGFA